MQKQRVCYQYNFQANENCTNNFERPMKILWMEVLQAF